MNETMTDGFTRNFFREPHFLHFLQKIEDGSSWMQREAKELRIVAMESGGESVDRLREQYHSIGQDDIWEDTENNTGLLLKSEEELYPVRGCAIKTILERARIRGHALNHVGKPELAQILNYCLSVARGKALLWYSEGKISAVHGGDPHDYAVLEIPALFEHTVAWLNDNYPGYTFAGGSFDHSTVTALWALTGQDKLVETYTEALTRHGLYHGARANVCAAVRLTTSNTGISGANLYPMLFMGAESRSIPLGHPLKENHKGDADLNRFDENLSKMFSQYDRGLKALTALLDIELRYPVNALLGVMKDISIPKRVAMEIWDTAKTQIGEEASTAHEMYCYLAEAIFILQRDGASGSKVAQMEETVARGLHCSWQAYDLAHEPKW